MTVAIVVYKGLKLVVYRMLTLKQALTEAGRSYETNGVGSRSAASPHFNALPPVKTPLFGKRIQLIPSFVSSHSK